MQIFILMDLEKTNENSVELIGYYGGDTEHACSAWTSTSRELTPEKIGRIPNLLAMLAENGHETPFEKSSLHFLVNTDIATHIHILKHRISVSVNAESARYKELKEDKYYLPTDWFGIPANTTALVITGRKESTWEEILAKYTRIGNQLYHDCLKDLEPLLGRKRAKESARFFKTYSSQIQADVMFNFRSFVHFLKLRNKPDAQMEIRHVAQNMLDLVKNIPGNPFGYSLQAFNL
jgi:flavin-dependent thymidylate synthase